MENKKSFWGCKPLQKKPKKKHIKPRQNFTGSYKKSVEMLDELQDTQSIKS